MRIGITGGKYDMVHNKHLVLAERARVQHNLDFVLVVTAGEPVDKKSGVTDKEIRHHLVEVAIADNPYLQASRVEVDRSGPAFMADTLRAIRAEYGEEHEYFLIIGEDRAPTISQWHEPEVIVSLCTFLVGPRTTGTVSHEWLAQVLPPGARFGSVDFEESSTFMRREFAAGRSVRYMVPDSVLAEIARLGLYGQTAGRSSVSRRSRRICKESFVLLLALVCLMFALSGIVCGSAAVAVAGILLSGACVYAALAPFLAQRKPPRR